MQLRNTADRYGVVSQSLHWLTVILVVVAWMLGDASEDRSPALSIHASFGVTILAVLALRLAWRLADPPPHPVSTPFGAWGDRLARVIHVLLYILLALVPLSGIALQFGRGEPLPLFGLFEIAPPSPATRATVRSIKEMHEVLANALLFVALAHAAAAAFHHWILRDRALKRMLPGAR